MYNSFECLSFNLGGNFINNSIRDFFILPCLCLHSYHLVFHSLTLLNCFSSLLYPAVSIALSCSAQGDGKVREWKERGVGVAARGVWLMRSESSL
jgi:hypothetical protein